MPEFPDPVKPGKQQHLHQESEPAAYYQQVGPSGGYQATFAEQARTACLRGC